ncbi:ABC transporter ATP-binding protein [Geovibrio ferrireducens]|uniref:ABC transporter ATP-binding protein n=1 Tax=Geovibrio ferrireducens TaxID=46201 RepID=UPI002245E5B7|nr:ATP-binding cassette domain-containing protein [Geovibrio ferrireducens]
MDSYLKLENISKSFGTRKVLDSVTLTAEKGEFISLLGPSGCGKTTLLRIIAGLEKQNEGRVILEGRDYSYVPASCRNFGIVFQSYALFPNLTVTQNIGYGLQSRRMSRAERNEIIDEMLDITALHHEKDKYPFQLSGGQQQRVALARALALRPSVLLLDEPLSALDAKVREKLRREIRSIHDRMKITTVMVTHDQEEAITISDKIAVMNQGIIEQFAEPDELYFNPKTRFIAEFIGMINFMDLGGSRIGIRPEQIKIASDSSEGHSAVVNDIEFRGSFLRLFLTLEHSLSDSPLIVDVHSSDPSAKALYVNSRLKVRIPESVISFQ